MKERPAIGARVRLCANNGRKLAGRVARVVAHHTDGRAFWVAVDGSGQKLCLDPKNVEPAEASV